MSLEPARPQLLGAFRLNSQRRLWLQRAIRPASTWSVLSVSPGALRLRAGQTAAGLPMPPLTASWDGRLTLPAALCYAIGVGCGDRLLVVRCGTELIGLTAEWVIAAAFSAGFLPPGERAGASCDRLCKAGLRGSPRTVTIADSCGE
jgi:hypothetical protein